MKRVAKILLLIALCPLLLRAQTKPDKDYLVYVLSEGADKIALVRFGPEGARVDRQIDTGDMPVDIDGPHGIVISPDRQFYYVSIAHGRPFGWFGSTRPGMTRSLGSPFSVTFQPRSTSRRTAAFCLS